MTESKNFIAKKIFSVIMTFQCVGDFFINKKLIAELRFGNEEKFLNKNAAMILVGLAGICWASSGVAVQDFFSHSTKTPMELTNIRMCSVQFTYFQAISVGGAAATTVILSATPAMVVIWEAFYNRRAPERAEIFAVIFAMLGVFLLVTGGNPSKLLVPLSCILWSLSSGAFFAFSMVFGKHLFAEKIDSAFMTSVGMFFGGLTTFAVIEDKNWLPFLQTEVIFDVAWIVIFGTAVAFWIFNAGLKNLTAEEAAVTSTTEPASSVVISYFVFGTAFGLIESAGIFLVLLAIISPAILKKN